MRRLPQYASFVLFVLLCASLAYWGTQLFQPPLRPVAAPPRAPETEIDVAPAASLFGAKGGAAAIAGNFRLTGVIFSGDPKDSVAILSADGKPAQAIRAGSEAVPGVTVNEVHRDHVLLLDNGTTRRVELPESAGSSEVATIAPLPTQPIYVPPAIPQIPPMPQQPVTPAGRVVKSSPPAAQQQAQQPAQEGMQAPQMPLQQQQPVQQQQVPVQPQAPGQMRSFPQPTVVGPPVVTPQPPRSVADGAPLQSR